MNNDKLENIKHILKDNYKGRISEEIISAYARDLYDLLFVSKYSLDDIIAIIS